jgi:hypothetical protein
MTDTKDKPDIGLHITNQAAPEDETETLVCNWCDEPHPATPEYKAAVLKRGAEAIAEIKEQAQACGLTPEQTWTCGKCIVTVYGVEDTLKHDCHDHSVPTREEKEANN